MLTEEFRKSRATILTLKMGKTFVGIDKLRAQFSKFPFPKALSHHHPFTGIVEAIDTFEKRYEAFLEDGTPVSTLEVIVSAMMLRRSIAAIEDFVHATVNILDPPFEPEKGCGILSLFLTSSEDYSSTIEKMAAVEGMYVELCNLLNVSTSAYPLKANRIESGSLWLKLFGESKVVAMMTSLIERSASFLYRNFTNEGKIESIPKKVAAIEILLGLSAQLEANGVETGNIKENIQKSAVSLSKHLSTLLAGEPTIEVNGKKLSVGEEMEQKFLSESRMLFLGDGKASATSEEPSSQAGEQ